MRSMLPAAVAVFFTIGAVCGSGASAEVLLAKSNINSFFVPAGNPVPVPLDNKGNTSLNFETKKKGIVVITYNVECAATGGAENWVGLQILVNGKATNPKESGDDFAICTASGANEVYTAVSRQAYIKLKAGQHSVEVMVSRQGVDSGRLDDSSIVIID